MPDTASGHALLERASIPEAGAWWRTDHDVDGVPVFVRLPLDPEDGHEDPEAVRLAWERLRHLEHPAVPRALRYDADERALFVAAPEGIPLAKLLEHRGESTFTMTPGTVLDIGSRLAALLVQAHERGRPHGHLSPHCIWVTRTGELVVWGFGVGPDEPGASRWWSPERARGRRASGDADQWALGAILASLITGRLPWRSEDPVSEARIGDATHLSGPVLEQWKPLGRLVDRALAAEARDRFPSVHPLRQALDALHQRVPQRSDLPVMGEELWKRYGRPDAPDVEDAPPVPSRPSISLDDGAEASDGEAVSPDAVAALALDASADPDASATEYKTTPTNIPSADDGTSVDELDDLPSPEAEPLVMPVDPPAPAVSVALPEPEDPTEVSAPTDVQALVDVPSPPPEPSGPGEVPHLGDVMVAERTEDPVHEPSALDRIPIRRVAPWVVAVLAALLLLQGVLWLVG